MDVNDWESNKYGYSLNGLPEYSYGKLYAEVSLDLQQRSQVDMLIISEKSNEIVFRYAAIIPIEDLDSKSVDIIGNSVGTVLTSLAGQCEDAIKAVKSSDLVSTYNGYTLDKLGDVEKDYQFYGKFKFDAFLSNDGNLTFKFYNNSGGNLIDYTRSYGNISVDDMDDLDTVVRTDTLNEIIMLQKWLLELISFVAT